MKGTLSSYFEETNAIEKIAQEGFEEDMSENAGGAVADNDVDPTATDKKTDTAPPALAPPEATETDGSMIPAAITSEPKTTDEAIAQAIKTMADAAVDGQPEAGQVLITLANKVKDTEASIAGAGETGIPLSESGIAEEARLPPQEEAPVPTPEEVVGGEEEVPVSPGAEPVK